MKTLLKNLLAKAGITTVILGLLMVITTAVNAAPPVLSNPSSSDITPTSATARVDYVTNSGGILYFAQYAGAAETKTDADIKAGVGALFGGNIGLSFFSGSSSASYSFGGTPNTQYTVYFVLENGSGFSNVESVTFTTLVEVVPPIISGAVASGVTATSAEVHWKVTFVTTGKVYYNIRTGNAVLTATGIKDGSPRISNFNTPSTNHSLSHPFSSLNPNTQYTVYIVAENVTGFSNVAMVTFTTLAETAINIAAIPGVTAPVRGAIPKTTITETSQYAGTIIRSPAPGANFAASTIYTATITLTPKAGFTLTGVAADFFTVAGATATNASDSGIITAVFPATGTPPASSGGWGGGSSASRDNCPDGDFSPSYYDGSCWISENKAENTRESDPKITEDVAVDPASQADTASSVPTTDDTTSEIQLAYEWAFSHNITTIQPLEKANPEGPTLRGHLAKMVTNYVLEVLGRELPEEVPTSCQWKDKASARESEEIKEYAVKACSLGLMGLGTDYFQPNAVVNRAQFGTVLSRILRQDTYEGGTPYYAQHLQALKDNGIMTQIDNPESRVELRQWIWVMLMRSGEIS